MIVQGTQAVDRAFSVLRAVASKNKGGITLLELVNEISLKRPTIHRLVLALMANGMVYWDPETHRYFVGLGCYALGIVAADRYGLRQAGSNAVARLARVCGDAALLTIRSNMEAVCVAREDGDYPLQSRVLMPGDRAPLGVHGGGLAILSALTDREVEECLEANIGVIAKKYPAFSESIIRAEVNAARKRGYAINPGLAIAGSWAISTAIHSANGDVFGALTIAAVEPRMQKKRERKLAKLLLAEKKLVEEQIKKSEMLQIENLYRRLPIAREVAISGPGEMRDRYRELNTAS